MTNDQSDARRQDRHIFLRRGRPGRAAPPRRHPAEGGGAHPGVLPAAPPAAVPVPHGRDLLQRRGVLQVNSNGVTVVSVCWLAAGADAFRVLDSCDVFAAFLCCCFLCPTYLRDEPQRRRVLARLYVFGSLLLLI